MEEEEGLGWLLFASIVLVAAGVMRIFDAIWAWRFDGSVPEELEDAILGDDITAYGWLWFVVGILLIAAGIAVYGRSQWARWVGIIGGAIATISAVAWLPVYPVWSLVYILIGILVIYGLSAYGGRLTR